ncbi:heat shock cognate 70 kDa protein-like protein [Tanacetum coccineum]
MYIYYLKFSDVKRLVGSRLSDSQVQEEIKSWPFKVIEGSSDKTIIVMLEHNEINKEISAEEISSMILWPQCLCLFNEPTAAAVAYGLDKNADRNCLRERIYETRVENQVAFLVPVYQGGIKNTKDGHTS